MEHVWTFPCRLDENYDGDTFKVELDVGFGSRHYAAVRLAGVDTPELRGGTALTKAAAKLARDEAARFILMGREVVFHCAVWSGKYGRPVGEIYVDGVRLSEHLIARRLGVEYAGGSRAGLQELHRVNAEHLRETGQLSGYGYLPEAGGLDEG